MYIVRVHDGIGPAQVESGGGGGSAQTPCRVQKQVLNKQEIKHKKKKNKNNNEKENII